MTADWGVGVAVQLHSFLTSTLDGSGWSSHRGCCMSGKEPGTH